MAEEEIKALLEANAFFATDIYDRLRIQAKNIIISPANIHSVLTVLSQDPWFYSKQTFKHILKVDDFNSAVQHYKDILTFLSISDSQNTLTIKNKAFYKNGNELQTTLKSLLTTNFIYELSPLDFTNAETAAGEINTWIEDATKKTADLVDSTSLNESTRLSLLNSMYLNSKWALPFNPEDTVPATFYINENDTVEVQMMRMKNEFYYHESYFGYKIVELPCINNEISLIVILPEQRLRGSFYGHSFNFLHFNDITGILSKQEVDISLPKFKMEEVVELKQHLHELGLENLNDAELMGVTENEETNLNEMLQKCFIEVNEIGTEAASGTVSNLQKINDDKLIPDSGMIIYDMNIKTNISNRFAKTNVVWMMKNAHKTAAEAKFKVVLTETAFITAFVMEIGGKTYKSYIKEKEEAKNIYNKAIARGQSAGLVEAKTRDSKEFTVSVNLEPDSIAVFSLTYEEMLQRIHDQYELVLNICPGQIIENLNVEVLITESRPIKFVKTPPLRSGNDISITDTAQHLDPLSKIRILNATTASIKFQPDAKRQKRIAHYLGGKTTEGLSGQFIIQYDVERDPKDGEILLQDGYFVHFFAPNDLDPLPKHVVFVLDTSGSMHGRNIEQLKDAMMCILSDLRKCDLLSIIEFESNVSSWDIESERTTIINEYERNKYQEPFKMLCKLTLPEPIPVNEITINKAKSVIKQMKADGGTFINGALETALYLVKMGQKKYAKENGQYQPIIVFLTDGEPTAGICQTDEIVNLITHLNLEHNKVPIFTLSFGQGADKNFLRKLSLKNFGFSRHIYQASDASLQLQEFYKQISSPLLADIKFKYDAEVNDVTRTIFPIFFRGSELVVAGRYTGPNFPTAVNCCGPTGPIIIGSIIERPVTSLERLWAYLTVKQILDERETVENKEELTKKAVQLALKYSFVTDVTSLVVVKPNETNAINESTENMDWETLSSQPHGMPLPLAQGPASCSFLSNGYVKPTLCCAISLSRKRSNVESMTTAESSLFPSQLSDDHQLSPMDFTSGTLIGEEEIAPPEEKKKVAEFIADHPFLIILLLKKSNKKIILFNGFVYKPSY